MGRAVGDGEAGGRDLVDVVGERHHVVGARHGLLGEAATIQHCQDALPDAQAADAVAHRVDLACDLESRGERQAGSSW